MLFAQSSCVRGDVATVTISYEAAPSGNAPSLDPPIRQRIITAFNEFTSANGYKCRPHVKRVQEITCRGPRDMHVTFRPELNRRAFVVRFNWLETGERRHPEFVEHTSRFAQALDSAVEDADVQLVSTGLR